VTVPAAPNQPSWIPPAQALRDLVEARTVVSDQTFGRFAFALVGAIWPGDAAQKNHLLAAIFNDICKQSDRLYLQKNYTSG
jgi:hypothetical protein